MISILHRFAFGFALLAAMAPAWAKIIRVGADAGCNFPDIQSALNYAGDHDELHLTSKTFANLHLHIVDRALTIIGGYDACSSEESSQKLTVLNGSGGGDSILLIDGSSNVTMKYLSFADTTLNNASTHGAGINYRGHGSLTLENVAIVFNSANYGAGLNVSASGPTDVYLNDGTVIAYNVAYQQGGGVNIEGQTHLYMTGKNSSISYNTAGQPTVGNGGGLQIVSPAQAEIGSPGSLFGGAISHNQAAAGGGVAIEASGVLRLYSIDNANPVSVSDNVATVNGGGIHMAGRGALLCGSVQNIDRNVAPDGAAIYTDNDTNYIFVSTNSALPDCAPAVITPAACPRGRACNTFDDNVSTQDGSGTIVLSGEDFENLSSFEMRRNSASHAIRHAELYYTTSAYTNCLIADNVLHDDVLYIGSTPDTAFNTSIAACTFALNALDGGARVIHADSPIDIRQSILWQPGHVILDGSGTRTGQYLIVNDSSTFFGLPDIVQAGDPGFISPGDDYHLRLSSPGLDYLTSNQLSYTGPTLDGYLRGAAASSRFTTPFDVGPYERQTAGPGVTFPFVENFDELDPTGAELPSGWGNYYSGANTGWFATKDADASSAYAMHTADSGGAGQAILVSPNFATSGLLIFRHKYQLEPTYDIALLEVKIGNSDYRDILDAGGRFVQGGYDNIMALGNPANPIDRVGKPVWSNDLGARPYSTVKVVLPPLDAGNTMTLRWHVGSDGSGTHPGYWLDSIKLIPDAIFTDSFGG